MITEDFFRLLGSKFIAYKLEGNIIDIYHQGGLDLRSLTALPKGVQFNKQGDVHLYHSN